MKKKNLFLTALALALVLCAAVGSAWAYFTANASAVGRVPIELGGGAQIEEEFGEWTKTVTIRYDTGDPNNTQPVYVRFRAFGPSYEDGFGSLTVAGEGWTQLGDWYYYGQALDPEHTDAGAISVKIDVKDRAQYDKFLDEGDGLDVVVVYESAPVLYNADGSPMDPTAEEIWSQKVVRTEDTFEPAQSGPEGGE